MNPRAQVASVFALLALAGASPLCSQTQPTIRSTADEVVVDVIVRGKDGKFVRDLQPADFEVRDNGEHRTVRSVRLIEGKDVIPRRTFSSTSTTAAPGAPSSAVAADPLAQVRLVSLVFDNLGDDGRRLSRQAALDLIKGSQGPNVYYAVFVSRRRLNALTPFTQDREELRKAIELATSGASNQTYITESELIERSIRFVLGEAPGSSQGIRQQALRRIREISQSDARLEQRAMSRMLETLLTILENQELQSFERTSRGSIASILNLSRAQMKLAGRKAILFFSEGLIVPPHMEEFFRAALSAANRSGVSIYAIDARGLTTTSENTRGAEKLAAALESSRNQQELPSVVMPSRDQVRATETAEMAIRSNDRNALWELAEKTGGFVVSNTNDLRGPLRRINEDINTWYEISYGPDIDIYDGSFHQTTVKVNRPGVVVQARAGYYALPSAGGRPMLLPFEVPLMKALTSSASLSGLEVRAGALAFQPSADHKVSCSVVVEVPMSKLKFLSQDENHFRAHLSMLALVHDASGEVVERWSRDVPLEGTSARVPELQQGNFIYREHFAAPPGRYTIEAAVADRESGQVGTSRSEFTVPAPSGALAVSDISLVRTLYGQAEMSAGPDLFDFGTGKISPTLVNTVASKRQPDFSLFLVVYPDPAAAEKPELTIEFLEGDEVIATGNPALPPPDDRGRIPYILTTRTATLEQGSYLVRATVRQGSNTAQQKFRFSVE